MRLNNGLDNYEALIFSLKEWLCSELCVESGGVTPREIDEIAEAAVASRLTVVDLGKILKKSRRQTYRLIHLSFGRPAGKLLTQMELQKAKFLLKTMNLNSISELMEKIDWNNQFYFCSIFEDEFGYHPGILLER